MQRVELSIELTEGEVKRIAERGKAMGLGDKIYLAALVMGFEALGINISDNPLSLIADDI